MTDSDPDVTGSSLSSLVVEAVARREGVEPTDLRDPLFAVIDPEALDNLFRDGTGTVTFEYHGYRVVAESDGEVTIDD